MTKLEEWPSRKWKKAYEWRCYQIRWIQF